MVCSINFINITINSGTTTMATVCIYDISGRLLTEKKDVCASETTINTGATNQVLLVEVATIDGIKATKKIVN